MTTWRIVALGFAIALVVLAVQVGTSLKGFVEAKLTRAASMPAVLLLPAGSGNIVCHLHGDSYACTAPRIVIPPEEPTVAGAR